ncbi:hypothetical protein A0U40_18010 [[Bacillus] sp. KCTC 13219]|nr:hypothetical protein A0U40_18010 [[Bacillus] sp. KCTC 13219]
MVETLMNMLKDFLNGDYPIEDFSWDFPNELVVATPELEKQYPQLSALLNEDMPEVCCGYETDANERKRYPDLYFSEEQIREKTLQVYKEALKLLN